MWVSVFALYLDCQEDRHASYLCCWNGHPWTNESRDQSWRKQRRRTSSCSGTKENASTVNCVPGSNLQCIFLFHIDGTVGTVDSFTQFYLICSLTTDLHLTLIKINYSSTKCSVHVAKVWTYLSCQKWSSF